MQIPNNNLAALVHQFAEKADDVIRPIFASVAREPAPERLYHYTDYAGLKGILETGTIWLSDIFRLNDPSEISHGIDMSIAALSAAAEQGSPELKMFAKNVEQSRDAIIEKAAHYFVASLSKTSEELGQWRAYADDGCGYALGFDGVALEREFCFLGGERAKNNHSFFITYDDKLLRVFQSVIVDLVIPYVSLYRGRKLSNNEINNYMNGLSLRYLTEALRLSILFKHVAYEQEGEYRFMQVQQGDMPPTDVKFRLRPDSLVRYVEFNWQALAPLSLREVVIGPAADVREATMFVNDCLAAYQSDAREKVQVRKSTIPYRSARARRV